MTKTWQDHVIMYADLCSPWVERYRAVGLFIFGMDGSLTIGVRTFQRFEAIVDYPAGADKVCRKAWSDTVQVFTPTPEEYRFVYEGVGVYGRWRHLTRVFGGPPPAPPEVLTGKRKDIRLLTERILAFSHRVMHMNFKRDVLT